MHTVVGRVLLASDHLLGMEQAAVSTSSDFIDNIWLQINVDGSWDVLSLTCRAIVSLFVKDVASW
jgi:hypothetical protein